MSRIFVPFDSANRLSLLGRSVTKSSDLGLSLGQAATLACMLEVTAPKPGNVHRGADFEDMTFLDFLLSAFAIAPAIQSAQSGATVGHIVYNGVRATRKAVGKNTNLGTLLLLAPLAKAEAQLAAGVATSRRDAIERVLGDLTPMDALMVYQAIRIASPGGLGTAAEADVHGPPPDDLVAAMRLAADRDLVARQYANGFAEVLGWVVSSLAEGMAQGCTLLDTIVRAQIIAMMRFPDSLIARKCGQAVAQESSDRAAGVFKAGVQGSDAWNGALADFDFWLRSDGHRRNPGTTADLLAAGLFVCIREGVI